MVPISAFSSTGALAPMPRPRGMSRRRSPWRCLVRGVAILGVAQALAVAEPVQGWLNWRGPHQNGTSDETGLPEQWQPGGANDLWSIPLHARSSPVAAGDRVYVLGYTAEGPELQEVLVCLDAATGHQHWDRRFSDFLSDIVYNRYSIGAPAVDPETGAIYTLTSAGILAATSPEGKPLWEHSMMEEFGRLTFPNGRTGAPAVEGELVIVHGITSNWGADGPAADRFYAFDKRDGRPVWSSTPGGRPKDSSFSTPVFEDWNGRRVLYCGTGDGGMVTVDARTGEPLWRYTISRGGVNSSLVAAGEGDARRLIGIHNDENVDSSNMGSMVAVTIPREPARDAAPTTGARELAKSAEAWQNALGAVSSSPVVVGGRLYQTDHTGFLNCVDVASGKVLWQHKLGPDQLHASPLYADGKLYIPMQNGSFHIVRPGDGGAEVLSSAQLEGNCLGAPAVWQGRVFVTSTERLYAFGRRDGGFGRKDGAATTATAAKAAGSARDDSKVASAPGKAVRLQAIPNEVLLHAGESLPVQVRSLDEHGAVVEADVKGAAWEAFIPPTARVKSKMDAAFDAEGRLVAAPEAKLSAGAFRVTGGGLSGLLRGRVFPSLPLREDFNGFELSTPHAARERDEQGVMFAYPPLPWIGARLKWEVRELAGEKVLAKTIDVPLFQRAMTFIGTPEMHDYTVEADVLSEGTKRRRDYQLSNVGVINQRYIINLVGNWQQLEVLSNQDRVKVTVPFAWLPDTWYRLKTRVDVAEDGSGVVRAKAWKRGEAEPAAWTIEAPHAQAHRNGAPGFYGFALQNRYRVFIDNITVTPNAAQGDQ